MEQTLRKSNSDLGNTEKVKKENINIKAINMIYPVTVWFKVTEYKDKKTISILSLVESTWISIYPRLIEIVYNQGKEFIGRGFIKSPIEMEYGITAKPFTLGNPTYNAILWQIHQRF